MFKWIKSRIELLKNDKELLKIFLLHLLLIALHVYENYVGNVEYHWYLRAGGCGLIALMIFLFGRKGLSYALVIYSCTLIYVNSFYNYATIFFMLIAIGANPKIKKVAPWIYLVNVVISFTLKRLGIIPFLIHVTYIFMFYTKMSYVFAVNKPAVLNLTDSEKAILSELAEGKLQKEIDLFSQQTISQKLKNARERNMCDNTNDLVTKYKEQFKKV
jgi:DNA-binding CsgD family transcriptional regulator